MTDGLLRRWGIALVCVAAGCTSGAAIVAGDGDSTGGTSSPSAEPTSTSGVDSSTAALDEETRGGTESATTVNPDPSTDTTAASESSSTVASTDGSSTGSTGSGIDTGASSSGTTAGDTAAMFCIDLCTTDADCLYAGDDIGLDCGPNAGTCLALCAADDDCLAIASGWTAQPCVANDDCGAGPCVDYGGVVGGCAIQPSEFLDCADFMQVEVMIDDVDGNTFTVCANDQLSCQDVGGDDACASKVEPSGFTCADLMCAAPLTCDEESPGCNCDAAADCGGQAPIFDGTVVDCVPGLL